MCQRLSIPGKPHWPLGPCYEGMPPGEAFLNGLSHALHSLKPGQTHRLNVATRSDIAWWHLLCTTWSGVSVHQFLLRGDPDRHLCTDASGSWGCCAWAMPHWLQSPRPSHHRLSSIALKELILVVLAAATWGSLWGGLLVMLHSDNMAVVSKVNSPHARDLAPCNMLCWLQLLPQSSPCCWG